MAHPVAFVEDAENWLFWHIEISGKTFAALIDPGSRKSYVGAQPAELLKSAILPTTSFMIMPNGQTCRNEFEVDLTFEIDERSFTCRFKIAKHITYDCIVGIDLLAQMEISIDFGKSTWTTAKNITRKFIPVHAGHKQPIPATAAMEGVTTLATTEESRLRILLEDYLPPKQDKLPLAKLTPHFIDVQGHRPIKQKMRRIPDKLLKKAHEEIDRLLADGIIEPSESPWSSCPVIVPKKDDKIRFCIDYRAVNEVTKKDAYPLPHMEVLLDNLRAEIS